MILIADSGSTKTDWAMVNQDGTFSCICTEGINPVHSGPSRMKEVLQAGLLPHLQQDAVDAVWFYGAGCVGPVRESVAGMLRDALGPILSSDGEVHVESDMMAAARALCGHNPGIACILGTGANSCFYDGQQLAANTPPLGFILGDEGSGAYLGRQFLNGIFKGWLPQPLRDNFLQSSGLSYAEILRRVYQEPRASKFLASLVPFVAENLVAWPCLHKMVSDAFDTFLLRNVVTYGHRDLPVSFVGGVAWQFRDILADAVTRGGWAFGTVIQKPLHRLVMFHAG